MLCLLGESSRGSAEVAAAEMSPPAEVVAIEVSPPMEVNRQWVMLLQWWSLSL